MNQYQQMLNDARYRATEDGDNLDRMLNAKTEGLSVRYSGCDENLSLVVINYIGGRSWANEKEIVDAIQEKQFLHQRIHPYLRNLVDKGLVKKDTKLSHDILYKLTDKGEKFLVWLNNNCDDYLHPKEKTTSDSKCSDVFDAILKHCRNDEDLPKKYCRNQFIATLNCIYSLSKKKKTTGTEIQRHLQSINHPFEYKTLDEILQALNGRGLITVEPPKRKGGAKKYSINPDGVSLLSYVAKYCK